MRHFLTVVEAGSFSNAARRLNVANATVTQSIKNLEAHLGVRLLNRTTRRMNLTWEGSEYAHQARNLLQELDCMESSIVRSSHSPCGELRVEIPSAIGQAHFVPRLHEFGERHPDVRLTVFLNPGASSLIEEGIDVAVQLGDLDSSSLIARRVHTARSVACASPDYLKESGMPVHADELKEFETLTFLSPKTNRPVRWDFARGSEKVIFMPEGRYTINSSEALINMALGGAGIVYMLDFLVAANMRAGNLVQVLPEWGTPERGVYLVCPDRQNVPAKVHAFADFVEDVLAGM